MTSLKGISKYAVGYTISIYSQIMLGIRSMSIISETIGKVDWGADAVYSSTEHISFQ